MSRTRFIFFSCMTLVVVAAAGMSAAPPHVRHVSPAGTDIGDCVAAPCRTIGYALGQAAAGDTIAAAAGTYAESVLVTKQVSLVGSGATIDAAGHDNGVFISGAATAGSMLRGFRVENADLEGVLVQQTSNVTIEDNAVVHNDALWNPVNIPLPCQSSDDCGEGLHLNSVTKSTVRGNLVQFNVGGILLTDEMGPTYGNTIIGNRVLDNDKDCGITLASHYFSFAGPAPAALGGVYDNNVLDNDSERNGAAGIGIFAGPPGAAAYRNVVVGNTARDNGLPGVALHSHTPGQYLNDNVIVNNTLSGNGPDDDAGTGAPTGISVFSAVIPVERTVISANRISHEHFGIFTVNAVTVSGLPSNKFSSVDIPFSLH